MKGAVELIVLISTFIAVGNCTVCTTSMNNWFSYEYKDCSTGCCGDWPNQYCCEESIVWAIVGGVIGGIIFIACIIACICCMVKQQGNRGQVIAPATTGVTTIAYTTPGAQPGAQPYGYGYQQPAPGYQQPAPGYQQPAPGFQQPAPGYQQPAPGYQQPAPGFQQPAPGYQQPAPSAWGQSGGVPPPPSNYAAPGQSSQDPAFPPTKGP